MTLFDYAVLVIFGLSILLSVLRGLLQEALALAGWVLAFWLAGKYAAVATPWLPAAIPGEGMRHIAAFVAVFCVVWVAAAIVRTVLNLFLKATGLKPLDRLLGVFFGLARGGLLVLMLVMVAGMTPIPQSAGWRDAMLSPYFEKAVLVAKPWLPAGISSRIRFD